MSEGVKDGDPEFEAKKLRKRIISSHSVSLNLKDNNYWKPIRASSTRENTFV